ncbi:hypothetical protein PISMIDRAFT_15303 [Pisolithus microcarpus 441]|uniref:Uncharacterized protein n=1 Tax=Pisolithus microcarpus 441 TaxID=765257 RepID=A0A0C9Z408_9AGAM|nr:hypothetical protein PISMIDRAFT_15303 [Pisolithus microcarpus 441]
MRSGVLTNPTYASTSGARGVTDCHNSQLVATAFDDMALLRLSPPVWYHSRSPPSTLSPGFHLPRTNLAPSPNPSSTWRIWTYSTACQDDPNPYQIRTSRDTAFLLSFAFHLHTSTIDCFRNGYPNQLSPLLCHPLFVHPTIQGMASPDHDMNGCQPPGHHRTRLTHPTFITPFHKQPACILSQPSGGPIFDLRPPKFVVGAHEYT